MGIFGLITPDELAAALAKQQEALEILWKGDIARAVMDHEFRMHSTIPGPTGPTGPTGPMAPGPTGPGPTGPGQQFELLIPATKFRLVGSQGMGLTGDHIDNWGHPGEAIEIDVHARVATDATLVFDYVLASENGQQQAERSVTNSARNPIFPASAETWDQPVHGVPVGVQVPIPAGDSVIRIAHVGADWSNWLDLYSVRIRSSSEVTESAPTGPTGPPPGPTGPTGPPPTPGTGTLDTVLAALFPSTGPVVPITWGQAINGSTVLPGSHLVLADGDVARGGEWVIRGLRGTPDKWITIRSASPLGFKVRDLQVWRGLGVYDGQYVRVDGLDGYGSGRINPDGSGDFTSFIELVGGHHVAATRCRATNTGGHCVSATWSQSDGMEAPANVYMLYNTALDTSKRNPFNGSAFNLFHGTSKRTPDGPLAHLGYTDYVIGNVAFGCRSEVSGGAWGITDGNLFILDVGRDSGYDGMCLVAFNLGADNGGRGVHTLQTDGLVALFNTCVGNQTNVTEPASGEFSPHTDNGQRCETRGNIAAATTRSPAVWYQDWESGNGGHLVRDNVVLAGMADAANNGAPAVIDRRADGLGYLLGGSTKSRAVNDYRPKAGKGDGFTDADLASRFAGIAAVFPDALGAWRTRAVCGALDPVS